jgi:predicted Zn-dependent peptidase
VSHETIHEGPDGAIVRRTVLPNGLRVLTESVPSVRSTTFGVWVGAGSREESGAHAGAAHYLEHVPFRATATRTGMQISGAIEGVGGDINAFTSKEHTCFYARTLDEDLPMAADVIAELVARPLLRDEDIEQERSVILEEIAMYDDNPADLIHDRFASAMFGRDHSLGRPILGTVETIKALSPESIREFWAGYYRPEFLTVAAAGNLEHDVVVDLVQRSWAPWQPQGEALQVHRSVPTDGGINGEGSVLVETKDTEQANVVIGVPGITHHDERRWALSVLNLVLGGGMSSRLFDEVREKRGLAYSVYSYVQSFSDAGQFGVYVGCQPARVEEAVAVVMEQLDLIADSGITADELGRAKGGVRGGTVLSMEDTFSRMARLGKAEVSGRPHLTVDDILERISAVTLDEVAVLARELLHAPRTAAVIGPFDADRTFGIPRAVLSA